MQFLTPSPKEVPARANEARAHERTHFPERAQENLNKRQDDRPTLMVMAQLWPFMQNSLTLSISCKTALYLSISCKTALYRQFHTKTALYCQIWPYIVNISSKPALFCQKLNNKRFVQSFTWRHSLQRPISVRGLAIWMRPIACVYIPNFLSNISDVVNYPPYFIDRFKTIFWQCRCMIRLAFHGPAVHARVPK